jgi:hypothetical protein
VDSYLKPGAISFMNDTMRTKMKRMTAKKIKMILIAPFPTVFSALKLTNTSARRQKHRPDSTPILPQLSYHSHVAVNSPVRTPTER